VFDAFRADERTGGSPRRSGDEPFSCVLVAFLLLTALGTLVPDN
jgi:hypothetical protein